MRNCIDKICLWSTMFIISIISVLNFVVALYLSNLALDFLGLSKLFNNLSFSLSSNKNISEIIAINYLKIILLVFPLSYILFSLTIKHASKIKGFKEMINFYNQRSGLSLAYYTVVLVFFGFLPLFLNLLDLEPPELKQLNDTFFFVSLASILPYFRLLTSEAKEKLSEKNLLDSNINYEEKVKLKKKYDNIYFVLSVVFLIFIFILIFVMYQQKLDWNAENISIIVSTLGTLATFTAAAAAAWAARTAKNSLLEQSGANERAAKPYLVLQDQSYEIEVLNTQHPFFFNWDNGNEIKNTIKKENNSFLQIDNLSNGIAKKVEVKTYIRNYSPLIEEIKKIERTDENYIDINVEKTEDDFLKLKLLSGVKSRSKFFNRNQDFYLHESIDRFTALGNKNEKGVLIKIPQVFMVLINLFIIGNFKSDKPLSLPYLEIEISCESIQEKQYFFKYYFHFRSSNTNEDLMTGDKIIHFNTKVIEN